MAIPKPLPLKDFFKTIGDSFMAPVPQSGFSLRSMQLPNNAGTYQSPTPNMDNPPASVAPAAPTAPTAPVTPAPQGGAPARVFSGAQPTPAPVAAPSIPPQWIKPGGGFYTPDEVAANILASAPKSTAKGAGDIAKFSGDMFANPDMSSEDLMTRATLLNNARNDIAVGESDPFGVGAKSGIAYSPSELAAIERAYAGIYDPAINTALAKLETKQKADEEERAFQRDLQKMEKQFQYDLKLKKTPTPSSSGGTGAGGTAGAGGKYASDLDAIIGNTVATIQSKFGQEQFQNQIARARNDADKISTVASVVLRNAPAEVRNDFSQQAVAVSGIDKAIELIDQGVKTGFLQNGVQKTFNVFGKDYDPNLTKIASYLTSAIQPYRNSITGAVWGDQENAEYEQLFGSTKYSPEELKNRLTTLKDIMKTKSAQGLNVYVNPIGTYDNVFEGDSPEVSATGPDQAWLSSYDYDTDLKLAREAIAAGADKKAVKARLLLKYKKVDDL